MINISDEIKQLPYCLEYPLLWSHAISYSVYFARHDHHYY